jgi:hypothetical protein
LHHYCHEEGEAEEKQLEGQREVLQKAQVKRKRYEGRLAASIHTISIVVCKEWKDSERLKKWVVR